MKRVLWLSLLLAGCTRDVIAPSLEAHHAPLLDVLPRNTTLWGGMDLRAARALPGYATMTACASNKDAVLRQLSDLAGTTLREDSLDAVGLSCGAGGCVAVGRGALQDVDLAALAAHAPQLNAQPGDDGKTWNGTLQRGEPVRLRRLDGPTLVTGDANAVDAVGTQTRTPVELQDVIPRGQVWMAAVDAPLLFEQAAARLEANGSEPALQLAQWLRAPSGAHQHVAGLVKAVGFSLDLETAVPVIRLRLVGHGTAHAWTVATEIQGALAAQRARTQRLHAAKVALETATVARVGSVVEVAATLVPCGPVPAAPQPTATH